MRKYTVIVAAILHVYFTLFNDHCVIEKCGLGPTIYIYIYMYLLRTEIYIKYSESFCLYSILNIYMYTCIRIIYMYNIMYCMSSGYAGDSE